MDDIVDSIARGLAADLVRLPICSDCRSAPNCLLQLFNNSIQVYIDFIAKICARSSSRVLFGSVTLSRHQSQVILVSKGLVFFPTGISSKYETLFGYETVSNPREEVESTFLIVKMPRTTNDSDTFRFKRFVHVQRNCHTLGVESTFVDYNSRP